MLRVLTGKTRLVASFLLAVTAVACGRGSESQAPTGPSDVVSSALGSYALTTVDGRTLSTLVGNVTVGSGMLTLNNEGYQVVLRPLNTGSDLTENGQWAAAIGGSITFTPKGPDKFSMARGTLSGSTFSNTFSVPQNSPSISGGNIPPAVSVAALWQK